MPQQNAFQIGKTNPFHDAFKNRTSVTGLLILTTVAIGSLVALQNLNTYKNFCVHLTSVFQHHAKKYVRGRI